VDGVRGGYPVGSARSSLVVRITWSVFDGDVRSWCAVLHCACGGCGSVSCNAMCSKQEEGDCASGEVIVLVVTMGVLMSDRAAAARRLWPYVVG
jgi:hypothetical protein